MPIYKMEGNDKQIDRVAYGSNEAKELEQKLSLEIKEKPPESRLTVKELFKEYIKAKNTRFGKPPCKKQNKYFETMCCQLLKIKS